MSYALQTVAALDAEHPLLRAFIRRCPVSHFLLYWYRVLASGDDEGSVIQWDRLAGKPLKVHEGAGLPVTSLLVRGDLIIAGYASGHIRIFRAAAAPEASLLEVEVAAHARCITALDWHPAQYTVRAARRRAVGRTSLHLPPMLHVIQLACVAASVSLMCSIAPLPLPLSPCAPHYCSLHLWVRIAC